MKINFSKKPRQKGSETIYSAKENKSYVIHDLPEISLLKNLGIRKNSQVFKKYTYRLGGPVLLMVDLREIALGKDIAEKIVVREA